MGSVLKLEGRKVGFKVLNSIRFRFGCDGRRGEF